MDLIRCGRCAKQIPPSSHYCRRCGCPADDPAPGACRTIPRASRIAALSVVGMSVSLLLAGWINMSRTASDAAYPVPGSPGEVYAADDGVPAHAQAAP